MRGTSSRTPELDAGQQVPVDGVHPTGAEQPDQVQGAALAAECGAELRQRLQPVELAGPDALGDADQVLRHHAAGPEVEVAHLAVAHLAFGQAHGQAAGVEQGARLVLPEPVPYRGAGQLDRVALAGFAVAPAVQNHEDHRSGGSARV